MVTRAGEPPRGLEPGLGRLPVGVTDGRQVPPPLLQTNILVLLWVVIHVTQLYLSFRYEPQVTYETKSGKSHVSKICAAFITNKISILIHTYCRENNFITVRKIFNYCFTFTPNTLVISANLSKVRDGSLRFVTSCRYFFVNSIDRLVL